ncbi:MAG: Gx transporter family protein [Oscillospiraceae bacterium]|nr:Gx transporter family protein [Oscillospiraceae bacterium]
MFNNKYSIKTAKFGMLLALSLSLSFLESILPPVPFLPPGAKLGLSNIVTMFAVINGGLPSGLLIAVLKSVFAGFTRGFSAFIISLCGGVLSIFTLRLMLFFKDRKLFGLAGVSVISAVFHNIGQLAGAFVLTGSIYVFGYLPSLILFGIIAGVITGAVLKAVMPALEKIM